MRYRFETVVLPESAAPLFGWLHPHAFQPSRRQESRHCGCHRGRGHRGARAGAKGRQASRGLTPDQFELFDGRKRRELTGFDVYDLSGIGAEPNPLGFAIPASAQRNFLLLFDLSLSCSGGDPPSPEAAKEVVTSAWNRRSGRCGHLVRFGAVETDSRLHLGSPPGRAGDRLPGPG